MCLKRIDKMAGPHAPMFAAARGFTLLSAIFLLIILSALGAFMVTFSTTQHVNTTSDLEGSRAYWAARTGIEQGLYGVLDPTQATVVAPTNPSWPSLPACFNGTIGPSVLKGALEGFNVVVACVFTDHQEGVKSVRVYHLTSTATKGAPGSQYFVQRVVRVTASVCRDASAPAAPYRCG